MTHASLPIIEPEPVVIPDCWYAIADASRVRADKPLGVVRLGKRWVLWRDEGGEVRCLPGSCPHRGADLALGRVREGAIECPYHGFRFAGSGACTLVPCEGKDFRIPRSLNMAAPTLREAHGLVWMWHGASEPGALPWIEGAPEPSFRHSIWEDEWDVCFTRVMEGMQDLHHFPFAHRKIDPFRGRATVLDPCEVEVEGDRIVQRAAMRRDEPGAKSVFPLEFASVFPGFLHAKFGERLDGAVVTCPIDDENTWLWVCYRVRMGLGPVLDRLAAAVSIWSEFAFVQPDDKRMLVSSQPQQASLHDQVLVRADAQIAAWHKIRRARLRAAAEASEVSSLDEHRRVS